MKTGVDEFGVLRVYPFGEQSMAHMLRYKDKIKINLSLSEWYTKDQLKQLIEQMNEGLETILRIKESQ